MSLATVVMHDEELNRQACLYCSTKSTVVPPVKRLLYTVAQPLGDL